jgi:hypothetical protein
MGNPPENKAMYDAAHLVVAAVRILQHRNETPPLVEDVAECIRYSLEKTNYLCNQLAQKGILEAVESAYGARIFIRNHLGIEDLPRESAAAGLDDDIRKFQSGRKTMEQKIESIKAKQAEKKKNLLAEMEKKLKREVEKQDTGQA